MWVCRIILIDINQILLKTQMPKWHTHRAGCRVLLGIVSLSRALDTLFTLLSLSLSTLLVLPLVAGFFSAAGTPRVERVVPRACSRPRRWEWQWTQVWEHWFTRVGKISVLKSASAVFLDPVPSSWFCAAFGEVDDAEVSSLHCPDAAPPFSPETVLRVLCVCVWYLSMLSVTDSINVCA